MKLSQALLLTATLSLATPLLSAQSRLTASVNKLDLAQAQGGSSTNQARLPDTLKKMDAAAARFKSVSADFHKDLYTKLINDTEKQEGSLFVVKNGTALAAGYRIAGPHSRILVLKNGIAKDDTPGRCYNSIAGKQGAVEGALTLGFGGSGTDLEKHWEIKDQGSETIKGTPAEKLDLTPKDPAVKETYTRVELWIDLTNGIAVQQKSYSTAGDTQTGVYSNIKLNQAVDMKPFEIKDQECSLPGKKK